MPNAGHHVSNSKFFAYIMQILKVPCTPEFKAEKQAQYSPIELKYSQGFSFGLHYPVQLTFQIIDS